MNNSSRLTKERRADLRGQLSDLGYGQAESETPDLFSHRLYLVPEHLRALDSRVVLVVGPRGAGKSALFRAIFSIEVDLGDAIISRVPQTASTAMQFDSTTWKAAFPGGTSFPDTQALERHIDSDEQAKRIWYLMLVRCLTSEFDEAQRTTLRPLIEPGAAAIDEILSAHDSLKINPTAVLDALEERLEREGRWIFIGYDELDTLGGFNWALTARMVRGLVSFWSDYSRRWRRIRAKIFLRSDLFRRHAGMGTADFAKLAANRAILDWSDSAILGMLVKRIANTSDELASYCQGARVPFEEDETLGLVPNIQAPDVAHRLLERMVGEYMGSDKKKGFVRNWILDHLRDGNGDLCPRTLVRLVELAAANNAANRTLRSPRLIHPTALRQALNGVSSDHVAQGISSEWPWLEGVKRRLRQQQLVPWQSNDIVNLLSSDWDETWGQPRSTPVRPPEERPVDLVNYLVELGIFRRRSDGRVDVPDLYLFGLELRRKGGVKVGARRQRS